MGMRPHQAKSSQGKPGQARDNVRATSNFQREQRCQAEWPGYDSCPGKQLRAVRATKLPSVGWCCCWC